VGVASRKPPAALGPKGRVQSSRLELLTVRMAVVIAAAVELAAVVVAVDPPHREPAAAVVGQGGLYAQSVMHPASG
jgi:hypothetical protein